jgi:hypothetical protein
MKKLFAIGAFLLSSLAALGQGPPALNIFTSPDGQFRFVYPESYELLVGERILTATQGRGVGIPVCEFSMALVCVIYPIDGLGFTKFEGAAFSVNAVPAVNDESDCLTYKDQSLRAPGEPHPSAVNINGRVFGYLTRKVAIPGHSQSAPTYRTFQNAHCYELRIAVSVSIEPGTQGPLSSKTREDGAANGARESLKMILSSVVFR